MDVDNEPLAQMQQANKWKIANRYSCEDLGEDENNPKTCNEIYDAISTQ